MIIEIKPIIQFAVVLLVVLGFIIGIPWLISYLEKPVECKCDCKKSEMKIIINDSLIEKLYQDKLKEYQDWGYANGLIMAGRILGENKWLVEIGWETEVLNCKEVVDDLYEAGYQDALKRPD